MFGLVKSAHLQMRATLPKRLTQYFDIVAARVETAIPSWWSNGGQDRALAIVMGGWIEDNLEAGNFGMSTVMRAKVAWLVDVAVRCNEKEWQRDGASSTGTALILLSALRDANHTLSDFPPAAPAVETGAPTMTTEEFALKNDSLGERIRAARNKGTSAKSGDWKR